MRKTSYGIVVLCILWCCAVTSASAQVSIGIGLPNVSIGINLPLYPELVPVPGYPVYYAPQVETNYFFYDGLYWVYVNDNWYSSYWYNGPWSFVEPRVVPLYILRVPVRYYRYPPAYFHGWRQDAPPRWGQHWGHDWERHRRGWDHWKRGSVPARAPLPAYQRSYSGDRYPRVEQQQIIRREHYRYQPRDRAVRQHFQQQREQIAPAPVRRERHEEQRMRGAEQRDIQRPAPVQHGAPPAVQRVQPQPQPAQQRREPVNREQLRQPGAVQHERQAPRQQGQEQRIQERGRSQEPRGQGNEQGREGERGRDRH